MNNDKNKEKNIILGDSVKTNKVVKKDNITNEIYINNQNLETKDLNYLNKEFLTDINYSSILEEEDSFEDFLENIFTQKK